MALVRRLEAAVDNQVTPNTVSLQSAQARKITSKLARLSTAYNADDENAFLDHLNKLSTISLDTTSKSTINVRTRISNMWLAAVHYQDKTVTEEYIWHPVVVAHFLHTFLPIVVLITPPRKGYTTIRSSTLQIAYHNIIILICQNVLDPATGTKAGFRLLTHGGEFIKLKYQLAGLINDFKLERSARVKLYYGRQHIHHILKGMLQLTEQLAANRQVILCTGFRFLLVFLTTCRPSTTGPTEPRWAEAGRFPILKNIKIYRRGYCTFDCGLVLDNFKQYIATVNTMVQNITLSSVLYAHNVFLDPTIWLIAYLFSINAFEKKYETIDDLINDTDAELTIDPAMWHLPLFREVEKGGRGFTEPPKPATAESLGKTFAYWCTRNNLPATGIYAMRRESGNMYANLLGRRTAKFIMNHQEALGVLELNYLKGMADLNLVSLLLGEIAGTKESRPGEVAERDRKRHLFGDVIVESFLRFKGKSLKDIKAINKEARRANVKAKSAVTQADINTQTFWNDYLKCFTFEASNYTVCCKRNVTNIWNAAHNEAKPINLRNGSEEQAEKLRDVLYDCFAKQTDARRKANRDGELKSQQDLRQSFLNDSLTGTTEEREKAMAEIVKDGNSYIKTIVRPLEDSDGEDDDDVVVDDDDDDDEDEDEDDEDEEKTMKQLEDYRDNRGLSRESCTFDKNIRQWDQNLRSEIRMEEMDVEQEEEYSARMSKEFQFVERMAAKGADEADVEKAAQADARMDQWESDSQPVAGSAKGVDESLENDVYGLSAAEVRVALLKHLLKPIMWERTAQVTAKDGKKNFPCEICVKRAESGGPPAYVAPNPWKYRRHKNLHHTPWKELELEMLEPGYESYDGFLCPYGGCDHEEATIKLLQKHMVGDSDDPCPNAEEYRKMKEEHDGLKGPDNDVRREKRHRDQQEEVVIPPTNEHVQGLNDLWEYYREGVDMSTVGQSPVDWASLQRVEFLPNITAEQFRTERLPEDESVRIVRYDD